MHSAQPATLYAGTNNGLYKSANKGMDWTPTALASAVYSLAIDPVAPNTLYAGGNVVSKSINGGESWTHSTGTSCFIDSLAINPEQTDIVYAGTSGCGIFKSINGGDSFTAANEGLTNLYISSIVIKHSQPSVMYASTSSGEGVFKSTNGGETWTAVSTGLPVNPGIKTLAMDTADSNVLYAGGYNAVYKSTNGGGNWAAVSAGLPQFPDVYALVIDPAQPATLYAGTWGNGVYRSTNAGASWTSMNAGLTHTQLYTLAIDPSGTHLYAGTYQGGVFSCEVSPGASIPALKLLLDE